MGEFVLRSQGRSRMPVNVEMLGGYGKRKSMNSFCFFTTLSSKTTLDLGFQAPFVRSDPSGGLSCS